MAIRFDRKFSFFALSLLGFEEARIVDRQPLDEFQVGYSVDEDTLAVSNVRLVRDILDHSVRQNMSDPTVEEWVRALGGVRKLDQLLVGREAYRQYVRDLKLVKSIDGFVPTIRGERALTEGVDTATSYDSYAVLAHRELLIKAAFGEIAEPTTTSRSWEGHESDANSTWVGGVQQRIRPFWWNNIYMGKFRVGKRMIPVDREVDGPDAINYLLQMESGSGKDWVPDIRVSNEIGSESFRHITSFSQIEGMSPWSEMEDHPVVKHFIDRFYNDPSTLTWKKVGTGKHQRWAAGMPVKDGKWMWSPLTHSSSKSLDWWSKNEGKEKENFYCRALYWGPWVIAYRKCKAYSWDVSWQETSQMPLDRLGTHVNISGSEVDHYQEIVYTESTKVHQESEMKTLVSRLSEEGKKPEVKRVLSDEHINVRMFKECPQTGWLSLWKDEDIHWEEWGKQKKRLLKLGAKDAYFGKPWKKPEKRPWKGSQKAPQGYADI